MTRTIYALVGYLIDSQVLFQLSYRPNRVSLPTASTIEANYENRDEVAKHVALSHVIDALDGEDT